MEHRRAPRGRPRSDSAQTAILQAARDLLADVGYEDFTIVAVVARAGVGRQTVYRWWPTKAALVADCVVEGMVDLPLIVPTPTGNVESDLGVWLTESNRRLRDPDLAPLLRALTAAASADAHAAARLTEQFSAALRDGLADVLRAGSVRGTVREDLDPEPIVQLLLGSMMYAIITRTSASDDHSWATAKLIAQGVGPT